MERGTHLETHHIERRTVPGPLRGINRLEAIQLSGPLPLERPHGALELESAESHRDALRDEAQVCGLTTPTATLESTPVFS